MHNDFSLTDTKQKYPRICSHRGFDTIAPENTIPAFACAIALGTEEIELDIWPTSDGKILVCHDITVDRTTDGHGRLVELTFDDITRMDAGFKFSEAYKGLRLPLFEDVLKLFARKTIINIHIKSLNTGREHTPEMKKRLFELSEKYKNSRTVDITYNKEMAVIEEEIELDDKLGIREYDPVIFQKIVSIIDELDGGGHV